MFRTGKFRTEQMRAPMPLLALLAGLVALFGFGINFGELVVDRAVPAWHDHGGHGSGSGEDRSKGPGGLAVADQGYVLRPRTTRFTAGELDNFRFNVFSDNGRPVTDFAQHGDRRMDLFVVRRDMSGYQHLYPIMDPDGTWTVPLQLAEPGSYRTIAEFVPRAGATPVALGVDLEAPGFVELGPISKVSTVAEVDGYTVIWTGDLVAGSVSRIWMHVMRDNVPVTDLDPFLGGAGHVVIFREGDLGYLHVRPVPGPRRDTSIAFDVDVPTAGYYRMFLEFQHHGQVRTAEFTAETR
ncbi:MAG TPA: hypothetical protein VN327_06540 [Pseudonocardiaceae bacterium]|nr:hypothetical protein [Pseudonocardiaceae bacterium]